MKAKIFFGMNHEYDVTINDSLKEISVFSIWDRGMQKFMYLFPIEFKKRVEEITGKTVEIEDKYNKEKVIVPTFKGKDEIEIRAFPKIYQIVEHRKQEDGQIKEIKHELDRSIVDKIQREVIAKMPLNRPIKTSTTAEKICIVLGIRRFNREVKRTDVYKWIEGKKSSETIGSFDFAKFFGNRKDYYRYFYLPMKVLVHTGKIHHHKAGKIERLN